MRFIFVSELLAAAFSQCQAWLRLVHATNVLAISILADGAIHDIPVVIFDVLINYREILVLWHLTIQKLWPALSFRIPIWINRRPRVKHWWLYPSATFIWFWLFKWDYHIGHIGYWNEWLRVDMNTASSLIDMQLDHVGVIDELFVREMVDSWSISHIASGCTWSFFLVH